MMMFEPLNSVDIVPRYLHCLKSAKHSISAAVIGLALLACTPIASAFDRACTAKANVEINYISINRSNETLTGTVRIPIHESELHLVKSATDSSRRRAKHEACKLAACALVQNYAGLVSVPGCGSLSKGRDVRAKLQSTEWFVRRACDYAKSGQVSWLMWKNSKSVGIQRLFIEALANRDGESSRVKYQLSTTDANRSRVVEFSCKSELKARQDGHSRDSPTRAPDRDPPRRSKPTGYRVVSAKLILVPGSNRCSGNALLRIEFVSTKERSVSFLLSGDNLPPETLMAVHKIRLDSGNWLVSYQRTVKYKQGAHTNYRARVIGQPVESNSISLQGQCSNSQRQ